jgi:acyl carrier protein
VAGPSRTPPDSGPQTPLSGAGLRLDSVELLEVVVACECEFGIMFDATRDLADRTSPSDRDPVRDLASCRALLAPLVDAYVRYLALAPWPTPAAGGRT